MPLSLPPARAPPSSTPPPTRAPPSSSPPLARAPPPSSSPQPSLRAPSNSPTHVQASMATQLSHDVQGDHDNDEAGDLRTMGIERDDAASTSLSAVKSLLLKRKLTGANVRLSIRKKKTSQAGVRVSPLSRVLLTPSVRISPQGRLSRTPSPSHVYPTGMSRVTKRRKLRSDVWNEFEPIYDGHLLVQAKCNHCLVVFAANRDNGISTCRRHLKSCSERIRMDQLVQNMASTSLSPHATLLKNWKFDQQVSREAMVRFIVIQELPFSLVEHEAFRSFVATLNPLFQVVSRTTVKEDVLSSYDQQRLALRKVIMNSNSRVCLTADMWTSIQTMGYLCITCHFIDNDWKLHKRIISFALVASPHDGLTMFNALLKSLRDWNLEHKLFSMTLDNAANNGSMVDHLKANFRGRELISGNGEMLHMRCAAHVLNLIVQSGFKVIGNTITRIRDSVKYVRSSQSRKERFEDIIVQVGISCSKRPSLDIPSRWNSTYLMLVTALEYRAAFDELYIQDPNFVDPPFDSDWLMATKLCKIFKTFYEATNVVSGSLYPTSHLYFHELWKVKEKLEHEASNLDTSIASMAVEMQAKLQKYWDLSFLQICIPIIFDPRFKLKFVSFRVHAGWGDKAAGYLTKVKKATKDMFLAYSSRMPSSHNENTQSGTNDQLVIDEGNPWADFEQLLVVQRKNKVKSELNQYLQDELFPRQKDFDILKWWMMHATKYPILSSMARDVLAAPASSVPSESAFSTGERTISEYRSRLTSKTVEALICLQDWLRAQGRTDVNIVDIDNTDVLEEIS